MMNATIQYHAIPYCTSTNHSCIFTLVHNTGPQNFRLIFGGGGTGRGPDRPPLFKKSLPSTVSVYLRGGGLVEVRTGPPRRWPASTALPVVTVDGVPRRRAHPPRHRGHGLHRRRRSALHAPVHPGATPGLVSPPVMLLQFPGKIPMEMYD